MTPNVTKTMPLRRSDDCEASLQIVQGCGDDHCLSSSRQASGLSCVAKRWPLAVLITVVAASASCSHKRAADVETISVPIVELTNVPGTTFQVTLKDEAVTLDSSVVAKTALAASKDGSVFVFQNPPTMLTKLKPGTVVLFSKLALRKIVSVQTSGALALVETQPATLSDAVREGVMKWNYSINFGEIASKLAQNQNPHPPIGLLAALERWLPGFAAPAFADDQAPVTVHHSGNKEGWQYDTTTTVGQDHMHIVETLARSEANGMTIKLRATGDLQNFQTYADIEVHDGVITKFVYDNKSVRGTLDFDWLGTKTAPGVGTLQASDRSLILPPLAEIPLDIGGFPFTMDIGSQMLIRPGFTGNKEMVRGHFTVHFSGDQGFSINNGSTTPDGAVHGDLSIGDDTTSMSAVGPIGFVAAISMPSLELKPGILSSSLQPDNSAFADQARRLLQQNGWQARLTDPSAEQSAVHNGVYVELITVTGMAASGPLVMLPCEQTTLRLSLKVGGAGNLGVQANDPSQVYELKVWHRINPPIVKCREGLAPEGGEEPGTASAATCDLKATGENTDYYGVPGGSTMQDFKGAFGHKGVDIQKLRDMPVFANLISTISVDKLNNVRAVRANQAFLCSAASQVGNVQTDDVYCFVTQQNWTGLGITGTGEATLQDAQVLVQPWSAAKEPVDSGYGGIAGLAAHYQYQGKDGKSHIFTVYLEYEHLITPAYPPRLDNGKYIDNQNNPIAAGTYQGCTGFGSRMQDKNVLSADQLAHHPLIGFLGATQNPHVHIQAAFSPGSTGYLRSNFFDPGVILGGH